MGLEVFDTRQPSDISLVSSIRPRCSIRVTLNLVMLSWHQYKLTVERTKLLVQTMELIFVSYESQIYRSYESHIFARKFQSLRHLRGYIKPKVPLNHGFRPSNLVCALSLTLRTVFRKEFQERSKLSVCALYRVIFLTENF